MKKRFNSLLLIALLIALLSSCATQIPIRLLQSAQYDMSEYRHIAFSSVDPYPSFPLERDVHLVEDLSHSYSSLIYPGYQTFLERLVSDYATKVIENELHSSHYFKSITFSHHLKTRDEIATLYYQGIDALLDVSVSRMDVQEYVFAKQSVESENPSYVLRQKVMISLNYNVIDTKTGIRVYGGRLSDQLQKETPLPSEEDHIIFAPVVLPLFEQMIDSLSEKMIASLVPTLHTTHISLMGNKPKNTDVEEAYKVAKKGLYTTAYTLFVQEWNQSKHLPSGYNAAILLESMGNREDGIALMSEISRTYTNAQVERQLKRMRNYHMEQERAEKQL